ncbi:MAG: 4'-phosphopantetheinyl transferase superfamily protein [Syntrophales bacterium]|nr:4'-phosphopantetheinyl transferase superfamily protein [Syntrophales bacterium]
MDLTDPGNIGKSGDKRFLQRVFTSPEREIIAAAGDPDAMMWTLWAAKETAYKVVRKIDPLAASTPRLYPVVLSPGDHGPTRSGMVYTPQVQVVIRVSVAGEYLHCIGATTPDILDHVLWDIERLPPSEDGGDHAPDIGLYCHPEKHCGEESQLSREVTRERRKGIKMTRPALSQTLDPSMAVRRHARLRLAALLHASAADITIRRFQDNHGWGPPRPYFKGKPAPFDLSFSHDGAFVAYAMIPLPVAGWMIP